MTCRNWQRDQVLPCTLGGSHERHEHWGGPNGDVLRAVWYDRDGRQPREGYVFAKLKAEPGMVMWPSNGLVEVPEGFRGFV